MDLEYQETLLILSLQVEKWFGKKKQIAAVRTVCSHIKNMFKGLTLVSVNSVLETIPLSDRGIMLFPTEATHVCLLQRECVYMLPKTRSIMSV